MSAVGCQVVRSGISLLGALLLVTGCTAGGQPDQAAPSTPPSVDAAAQAEVPGGASPSSEPSGQSVPGAEVPPEVAATLTDEELSAAGEAALAYRNAEVETERYVQLSIAEAVARGGVPIQTPQLQEILTAVAVGPEFAFVMQNPQAVFASVPTITRREGALEVLRVEVAGVELHGDPTTIDLTEGITGVVDVRSCVDVSDILLFDAQGDRLDGDDIPVRILTWDAVLWQLPHPLTGVPGWYLADKSGTEGAECEL